MGQTAKINHTTVITNILTKQIGGGVIHPVSNDHSALTYFGHLQYSA